MHKRVPDWLLGEWIIDIEAATNAVARPASQTETNDSYIQDMTSFASVMAANALQGITVRISSTEVDVSFQGQRRVRNVDIYELSDDVCTMKGSDGKIAEYHRTPTGFWQYTDDGKFKLFFKRKQN